MKTIIKCPICSKEFSISPSRLKTLKEPCCSVECNASRTRNKPNVECTICKKPLYIKPYRLNKLKTKNPTCSVDCLAKLKSISFKGAHNHQYGLKGDSNSSFKGNKIVNQYGYVKLYLPNHPCADKNGRYREHRYVIERDLTLPEDLFYYENDQRILKKEYDVHHRNENRQDNRIENLSVFTRGEHTTHHNNLRTLKRDALGKIIGVIKSSELLETPKVKDATTCSVRKSVNA